MISIDTAQKDWQKRMEASMSKKEKFLLITTDKKLAESLERNKFNMGVLKLILFGSTATGVGLGAGVSGLSGIAALAASTQQFPVFFLSLVFNGSINDFKLPNKRGK